MKKYVCRKCEEPFSSPNTFKNHIQTHSSEQSNQCDQCEKTFKSFKGLLLSSTKT